HVGCRLYQFDRATQAVSATQVRFVRFGGSRASLSIEAIVVVVSMGCGSPPAPSVTTTTSTTASTTSTTTSVAPLSFTAVWQVTYRISSCIGDRHCGVFLGTTRTFVLRFQQSGDFVSGVVVIRQESVDNAYYQGDLLVNVSGQLAGDGSLTVTGIKPAASQIDTSGEVVVRSLAIKQSSQGGLTGTLSYESRYTVNQNPETAMTARAGDIIAAARTATMPIDDQNPFQGHWVGRAMVRSCSSDVECPPTGSFVTIDLRLSQSGSSVAGTIGDRITVSGMVSSHVLALQGSAPRQDVDGGDGTIQLTALSSTIAPLGTIQRSTWHIR